MIICRALALQSFSLSLALIYVGISIMPVSTAPECLPSKKKYCLFFPPISKIWTLSQLAWSLLKMSVCQERERGDLS